jgi:two-component system, NtrC family, phosphoglycerate transport system response regulator PgtA
MTTPVRADEVSRRPAAAVRNLLVVDDDYSDMCAYCRLLRQAGYAVRGCSSYSEGKACLDQEPADLVIVGQGTPAFEGREVLQRAIEKDRHTPVLALTRSVDMNCYLEAMQLGAFDYLEKPVSASQVLDLVAAYLRNRN